jgi:hypothetical protein
MVREIRGYAHLRGRRHRRRTGGRADRRHCDQEERQEGGGEEVEALAFMSNRRRVITLGFLWLPCLLLS